MLKASKHNLLWFSVSKRSSNICQKTSYSILISLTSKRKHSVKYKDLLHSYHSPNISGECGNTNLTIFISCVCMQQSSNHFLHAL